MMGTSGFLLSTGTTRCEVACGRRVWRAGVQAKHDALAAARAETKRLEATGASARDRVVAGAREAALEAELVTGLKPVKLGGRGGGRGGGGRIGGGRGRGGR
jgi:hypothetical protein